MPFPGPPMHTARGGVPVWSHPAANGLGQDTPVVTAPNGKGLAVKLSP